MQVVRLYIELPAKCKEEIVAESFATEFRDETTPNEPKQGRKWGLFRVSRIVPKSK